MYLCQKATKKCSEITPSVLFLKSDSAQLTG